MISAVAGRARGVGDPWGHQPLYECCCVCHPASVGGGANALLSAPLLAIPSPLALAPVALLLLSSYLMNSWLMFSAALSFGVLHAWGLSLTAL